MWVEETPSPAFAKMDGKDRPVHRVEYQQNHRVSDLIPLNLETLVGVPESEN